MDRFEFIVKKSPQYLILLKESTPSLWGDITAQQMVEHLSLEIAYASKKIIPTNLIPTKRMAFWKAKFFNNDISIPKNFTAKGALPVGEVLPPRFSSLKEAIWVYNISVNEFALYFKKELTKVTFHPFFGYLSYDEWLYYLDKHIQHHFSQFGLFDKTQTTKSKS